MAGHPAPAPRAASLPALTLAAEGGPVTLAGVPWSWAYSLSSRHGPAGYLVVGAQVPPAEGERFLLQVLAQQAGVALANARLHSREREQAEELRVANLALQRSMEIHDRLTKVALGGRGAAGDRRGGLRADRTPGGHRGPLRQPAGLGRPGPARALSPGRPGAAGPAAGPGHDRGRPGPGGRAPVLGGGARRRPGGRAGRCATRTGRRRHTELVAMEHATTVLAMEVARLQSLAESDTRLRTNLVLDLVAGADQGPDGVMLLNRAQALGYDLGRPHRVVVVEAHERRRRDRSLPARGRPGRPGRPGGITAGATAARRDPAGRRGGVLGPVPGPYGRRAAWRPVPDRGGRPLPRAGRVPAVLPGSRAGAAHAEGGRRPRPGDALR